MKAMMLNEVPVSQNSQYTPNTENSTPLMIASGNSSDSNTAAITMNIRISAMPTRAASAGSCRC